MKKRILVLCLAGVFALSFAACGRQVADDTLSTGNATIGQTEEAQEAETDPVEEQDITEDPEDQEQEEQVTEDTQQEDTEEAAEEEGQEEEVDMDNLTSFSGSTTIATSVSDSYASIQDAYCDGGQLVIEGTYNIETDDGYSDTSDSGTHSFPLSGSATLGSMGGEGEPETMSPDEFNEMLQYDIQNNPGLGLYFYVEDGVVVEAWITS